MKSNLANYNRYSVINKSNKTIAVNLYVQNNINTCFNINYKVKPMIVKITDKKNMPRSLVGGKGYTLNKLSRAGFNVPNGFILTTKAFDYFVNCNFLRNELERYEKLDAGSKKLWCRNVIRKIKSSSVPVPILLKINDYVKRVGLSDKHLILRSSVEVEDAKTSSFAGQFKSVINVNINNVISSIKEIYASAFEYSIISYCEKFNVPINKLRVAIIFQEFIPGEISGVSFVDPLNNKKIIIEYVFGLNEGLVSGRITPVRVVVDLDNKGIDFDITAKQKIKYVMNEHDGTKIVETNEDIDIFLNKSAILSMSQQFKKIGLLFKKPQDVEWLSKNGELYLLQSRDITVMPEFQLHRRLPIKGNVLYGHTASAGVVSGTVSIIDSPKRRAKNGSVLVAEYTNMDHFNQIKSASGIITEEGGLLSHAAIVSRELKKPCVTGVPKATKILKNGDFVTVNGDLGIVLRGTKMHRIKTVYDKNEIEWETLLYFKKMKTLKIKNTDVYYEALPDKTIVYSKPHISKNKIKEQLTGKEFNIVYGSDEKRFLYSMYLDNIKDNKTKILYEDAFYKANMFNPEELSKLCQRYLELSKRFVSKSKTINARSHEDYLYKILLLRRAYSIYILIDEYICKGYAPYTLFKNVASLLESLDMRFSEFLYKIDSGLELDIRKLHISERDKLLKGIRYYKILKDWHQTAFYMFSKTGAIGKKYDHERDKVLYKLNKDSGIIRDEDFWYLKSLNKLDNKS